MKALSIRQPWAWLIVRPDLTDRQERARAFDAGEIKTIENRTWWTGHRGPTLIHAAKGMTRNEYDDVVDFLVLNPRLQSVASALPAPEALERGGIVGLASLVACVRASESPYFFGPHGFVFHDAKPVPFRPQPGALGFFEAGFL